MKSIFCAFLSVVCVIFLIQNNQGDEVPDIGDAYQTTLFPYFYCEGEDTGAEVPCPPKMGRPIECGIVMNEAVNCKTGNTEAIIGVCQASRWKKYCVHKDYGWQDGPNSDPILRGCIGLCEGSGNNNGCSYAPHGLTCHADIWWPSF